MHFTLYHKENKMTAQRPPLLFFFALLVILVALCGYMVGYASAVQGDSETIRTLDDNLLEVTT